MCLAVPMQIMEITERGSGVADIDGSRYDVDLSLIENPAKGDFVIVHAGFAIEKLDEQEANERLKLFEEMARIYQESHDDPLLENHSTGKQK